MRTAAINFPRSSLRFTSLEVPPDTESTCSDLQKHLLLLCPACQRSFLSGQVEESLQQETRSSEIPEGQEDDEGDTWLPATVVYASR